MYEYNDTNDDADLDKIPNDDKYWKFHELDNLEWIDSELISNETSHVFYLNVTSNETITERNHSDPFIYRQNGYFSLKVSQVSSA